MLSEELLQEIVLMAPGSVDELFEWDSLSSWWVILGSGRER